MPRPSVDERLAQLTANLRDFCEDEEFAANNSLAAEIAAQVPQPPERVFQQDTLEGANIRNANM